uniref:Uncharacterized protein n=1 Tax=Siphoviridae sp. ctYJD4 TaxID=2826375 RepID=A0A8S5N098_9CAUD|nr:MAG TPA: hypothetical protein [Siphoviridae sp. ctYJD4]
MNPGRGGIGFTLKHRNLRKMGILKNFNISI